MVKANVMAKMPMLSGSPSQQAMNGAMQAKGMPKMSPGKPSKTIIGTPPSTPVNKGTKQPSKKGKVGSSKSSIKGAPTRTGRAETNGRVNPQDMGI